MRLLFDLSLNPRERRARSCPDSLFTRQLSTDGRDYRAGGKHNNNLLITQSFVDFYQLTSSSCNHRFHLPLGLFIFNCCTKGWYVPNLKVNSPRLWPLSSKQPKNVSSWYFWALGTRIYLYKAVRVRLNMS